jgi:2-aminoadipate transaminase
MNYDALFSRSASLMRQSAIRQMGAVAAQRMDLISFAPGYPGPDSFAWDDYRAITDRLLAERGDDVLQYGPTRGIDALIEVFIGLLAHRGITATGETTLVTTGSQQGLDLAARTLLDPGDVVLVELPTYTGAIQAFRNSQASLVGVKQQEDGIDLDDLQMVLQRVRQEGRRVKFLYVVPNFQNPTGSLLSLEKRRRVLEWATREQLLIVEDDPYNDLYFEDAATAADTRPIKADDTGGHVIYLTSLSKTLAPGFRTAWVAAPAPIIAKFNAAKQASDLCTGNLDQHVVYEACRQGVLARRIPELRRYYQHKRTVMERVLTRELQGLITWPIPRGGFFLWATLPPQMDSQALLARALDHGVIFVAGHAFFVDGSGRNFIRLAFSLPKPDQIEEGVVRLAAAIKEEHAALVGEARLA